MPSMNQSKLFACLSLTLNSLNSVFKLFLETADKNNWLFRQNNWFFFWYHLKTILGICFLDSFLYNSTLIFIIPSKFAKIPLKQFTPSRLRPYILTKSTNISLKDFGAKLELDQLSRVKHHAQAREKSTRLTIRRSQVLKTSGFLYPVKWEAIQ